MASQSVYIGYVHSSVITSLIVSTQWPVREQLNKLTVEIGPA